MFAPADGEIRLSVTPDRNSVCTAEYSNNAFAPPDERRWYPIQELTNITNPKVIVLHLHVNVIRLAGNGCTLHISAKEEGAS